MHCESEYYWFAAFLLWILLFVIGARALMRLLPNANSQGIRLSYALIFILATFLFPPAHLALAII